MAGLMLVLTAMSCLLIGNGAAQACDDSPQNPKTESRRQWREVDDRFAKSVFELIALSPDGKTMLSKGGDFLFLHELGPDGRDWYPAERGGSVSSVAFSPDGKTFACGLWVDFLGDDEHGALTLRNVKSGKIIWSRRAHLSNVPTLSFSPDGAQIATGSWDETVKLWDAKSGKLVKILAGHEHSVYCVRFSPDGKTLASRSSDHTVRLWNVRTGKELHKLSGHGRQVYAVAFSPDGRILASGGPDKERKRPSNC